jgi:hypothetical protein
VYAGAASCETVVFCRKQRWMIEDTCIFFRKVCKTGALTVETVENSFRTKKYFEDEFPD